MRGARLALLSVIGGAALAVPAAGAAMATVPPSSPPGSSVPGTAEPGAVTATTIVIPPEAIPPRAGASVGELDRRADDETWSVRRLATATVLGIAALAIAGFVYGRVQSVTPKVGRTIARAR